MALGRNRRLKLLWGRMVLLRRGFGVDFVKAIEEEDSMVTVQEAYMVKVVEVHCI